MQKLATLLMFMLVSCAPAIMPTPTKTVPRTNTLTPTALYPTKTATAIITPSSTPEIIVKACPEIKKDLDKNDVNGTLILNGAYLVYDNSVNYYVLNPGSAYLWDIKNNKKVDVFHDNDEELLSFSVSPNHKWFVYNAQKYDGSRNRTAVADSKGKLIRNVVNTYWLAPLGWLDDQNLVIWSLRQATYGPPFPTLIYNPFTRASKLITPDYPDISVWRSNGWPDTETVYDPTLRFVAYITLPDPTGSGDVVLWDISQKKELIRLKHLQVQRNENAPLWSPDGQRFLIDAKLENHSAFELYSINLNGEIQQLTHFDNLIAQKVMTAIDLWDYTWSGDGRYIAFWYHIDKQADYQLALFDTSNRKIKNLCITSKWHIAPIWSPDNQQLLINGFINENESSDEHRAIIMDVEDNYAVEIARDMLPEGWLTDKP